MTVGAYLEHLLLLYYYIIVARLHQVGFVPNNV